MTAKTHEPDEGYRYGLSGLPMWLGGVHFFSEGLARGDLYFDDGSMPRFVVEGVQSKRRVPKVMLSIGEAPAIPELRWFTSPQGYRLGVAPEHLPEFEAFLQSVSASAET